MFNWSVHDRLGLTYVQSLSQNPHATSRVTNDENDREKGGDKDEHIHENHDIDVDMAYQARKDPTELAIDPSVDLI